MNVPRGSIIATLPEDWEGSSDRLCIYLRNFIPMDDVRISRIGGAREWLIFWHVGRYRTTLTDLLENLQIPWQEGTMNPKKKKR